MANELPITANGEKKLRDELNQLIKVEREEIKQKIAEARELGDLKENAEYHSAKEKQALLEGRISQLQGILAGSQVIDPTSIKSDRIVFGATVTLVDVEKGNEVIYQIVGKDESNIAQGKISFLSPLGKALIGKEEGDTVLVRAPKGDIEYEVQGFEFK
ncbi:MAG: transcription elongation factor GreA [Halobacteriovoraceae bacterium]|nr:transcription elongation factor GreA [Halobacteriovoraceae bacterium]|tara:strand:- start:130 stop:606 length:477 start_codon:yes stop_codon:yes gene_type:complete